MVWYTPKLYTPTNKEVEVENSYCSIWKVKFVQCTKYGSCSSKRGTWDQKLRKEKERCLKQWIWCFWWGRVGIHTIYGKDQKSPNGIFFLVSDPPNFLYVNKRVSDLRSWDSIPQLSQQKKGFRRGKPKTDPEMYKKGNVIIHKFKHKFKGPV